MGQFPACRLGDRRPGSLRTRHVRGQPADRSFARQPGGGPSAWLTRWFWTHLKAAHKVSFADAFVAATAQRLDATLVHKDPDFDALKGIIKLHPLPPKPGKTT